MNQTAVGSDLLEEPPGGALALSASGARRRKTTGLSRPRRVLFISYQFPPVGGAGVQRVTKFVKYLPEFGWRSSVLTVANPSVPAYDESLLADIPASTLVHKARTLEPSYALKSLVAAGGEQAARQPGLLSRLARNGLRQLANLALQPDVQVLWLPGALRAGQRLLDDIPHEAIVASGPPFSTFLVGALLSRQSGLPLLLDYRDEWSLSNAYQENRRPGQVGRFLHGHLQRWLVRQASALLATTQASAATLTETRRQAGSSAQVASIYNGFDPADFPREQPRPALGARYRLAYVGTLWNLTTVEPLVRAVRELTQRSPELASRLELVFAGRRMPAQQLLVDQLKTLPCRVVEHPYTDHAQAIELLRSADGLCLLLADLPGAGRVVPAKLFEYVAAQRPILAIAPPGEVWDLLREHPAASCISPTDLGGLGAWLARELRQHAQGISTEFRPWNSNRYDRRHQAGQLAGILNSLVTAARGGAHA